MRLGILSDIHANLEALEAVLARLDAEGVERLVCLGDVVGYGADPEACVALLRARAPLAAVAGNHDRAVVDERELGGFSEAAAAAARWTSTRISADTRNWLGALPLAQVHGDLLFVHATPRDPASWTYIFSGLEARALAGSLRQRVCFIGHSHRPAVFALDPGAPAAYSPDHRYIVNVGSVGQPRDADPRASCGLLDTVAGTYENLRVPYDIPAAARKILDAGLPPRLAHRLRTGS